MRKSKKSPPVLILIDIMMLIVFMYISSPSGDIKSDIYIDFSNGLSNETVIQKANTINGESIYYSIENENITPLISYTENYYDKVSCESKSCLKIIDDIRNEDHEYWIILPKSVMESGNSLIQTTCKRKNCNGILYIHAKSGVTSICANDNHYYFLEKSIMKKGKDCKYNVSN